MHNGDTYFTVNVKSEGLFKDKGSKFIAYVFPFQSEIFLKDCLEEVRAVHPKARHYCYAYRIGAGSDNFRANDDGEPSGSAGKPILNVILSRNLTDILIVVVRYFGGTLLGVPGLINAYKTASQAGLEEAEVVSKYIRDVYRLRFSFEKMNDVMRIVKESDLKIINQTYDNLCGLELEIRQSLVPVVLSRIEDAREIEAEFVKTI